MNSILKSTKEPILPSLIFAVFFQSHLLSLAISEYSQTRVNDHLQIATILRFQFDLL